MKNIYDLIFNFMLGILDLIYVLSKWGQLQFNETIAYWKGSALLIPVSGGWKGGCISYNIDRMMSQLSNTFFAVW